MFEAALHAEADGTDCVFYIFMWLVNRLQSGRVVAYSRQWPHRGSVPAGASFTIQNSIPSILPSSLHQLKMRKKF